MLQARNELAHDYDIEIVLLYCDKIISEYINLFYEFKDVIKSLELDKASYDAFCIQ